MMFERRISKLTKRRILNNMSNMKKYNLVFRRFLILLLTVVLLTGCGPATDQATDDGQSDNQRSETTESTELQDSTSWLDKDSIPAFDGVTYDIMINNNVPYFTDEEMQSSYDLFSLSEMDSLGRCGTAMAVLSKDTLATTERGSIGMIKPSGWRTVRYDDIVDGKYLYNRAHLLMFAVTDGSSGGRTNVEENLITGTRYFNADTDHGMLHYEDILLDYIESSSNHVLYRVTPVFEGNNLVAKGVLMEAKSMEDNGNDIQFCIFIYNEQPGITIDHSNGDSHVQTEEELNELIVNDNSAYAPNGIETPVVSQTTGTNNRTQETTNATYVLNTNSKKIHRPDCSSVKSMNESNKQETNESIADLEAQGYTTCQRCDPV